MKTYNTHALSWIRPPPKFNETLRGMQTEKDRVSESSFSFGRKHATQFLRQMKQKQLSIKHSDALKNTFEKP